ncbi:hypothetical protein [Catellatospora chokoriensis]|uniref:Uncharacterized protein n=1 Tax=Catellatospora chokoriensis TaxID=310353 RepID=A0A8J3K8S8_9ACTN|nr:hypothetical protein [Catellatospora chokoriensis]GIF94628.1 hypothetical protein Cch02nite_80720 [Catellatospora chokoriensis]
MLVELDRDAQVDVSFQESSQAIAGAVVEMPLEWLCGVLDALVRLGVNTVPIAHFGDRVVIFTALDVDSEVCGDSAHGLAFWPSPAALLHRHGDRQLEGEWLLPPTGAGQVLPGVATVIDAIAMALRASEIYGVTVAPDGATWALAVEMLQAHHTRQQVTGTGCDASCDGCRLAGAGLQTALGIVNASSDYWRALTRVRRAGASSGQEASSRR